MLRLNFSVITFLFFLFLSFNLQSQSVDFEKVKKICENVERSERVRVSVIRFRSRMRTNDHNQIGEELAAMLENALFKVNCFNVLASASNKGDFDAEYSWSDQGYTNNTGAQKGNLLGAQAIITGEITEYAEGRKSAGALGINIGKSKAHVGFVLQVMDPFSREVLFSESVEMEGKSKGLNGASLFGVKLAGSSDRSVALNDAVEKAIIKATEVLADSKDQWGIANDTNTAGSSRVNLSLSGADFSSLLEATNKIKSISGVESANMNMNDGVGFIAVITQLSNQELAIKINSVINRFEIIGIDNGGIQMTKK